MYRFIHLIRSTTRYASLVALTYFLTAQVALAYTPPDLKGNTTVTEVTPSKLFLNLGTTVINLIYYLASLAAIGYLVWGGIKYIQSGGDAKKAEEARRAIISAIVGIIVIVSAYFIIGLAKGIYTDMTKVSGTDGGLYQELVPTTK